MACAALYKDLSAIGDIILLKECTRPVGEISR